MWLLELVGGVESVMEEQKERERLERSEIELMFEKVDLSQSCIHKFWLSIILILSPNKTKLTECPKMKIIFN